MKTRRIVLLLALITILFACSDTPKSSSNATWDQSNFETANWN
jgi:outer membrane biogenesis lipoprotein LolB